MWSIFNYDFIIRAIEAGLLIALIAPMLGIFLVLRRYSLIADTLSHVSLAGVAIGLLLNINPIITALGAAVLASLSIERLRLSKKIYGESALSIFLSGSLALAIVLISYSHGFNVNLLNYLFGSIVTVRPTDVYIIGLLSIIAGVLLMIFFRQLLFISFDEEAAQVSGLKIKLYNSLFMVLSAIIIAISIEIVGVLLISALLVLPVITALQFKKSFKLTLLIAELISVFSMITGLLFSFYFNISSGGTIVLTMLTIFILTTLFKKISD
jgi:zinc transport system permease protein